MVALRAVTSSDGMTADWCASYPSTLCFKPGHFNPGPGRQLEYSPCCERAALQCVSRRGEEMTGFEWLCAHLGPSKPCFACLYEKHAFWPQATYHR